MRLVVEPVEPLQHHHFLRLASRADPVRQADGGARRSYRGTSAPDVSGRVELEIHSPNRCGSSAYSRSTKPSIVLDASACSGCVGEAFLRSNHYALWVHEPVLCCSAGDHPSTGTSGCSLQRSPGDDGAAWPFPIFMNPPRWRCVLLCSPATLQTNCSDIQNTALRVVLVSVFFLAELLFYALLQLRFCQHSLSWVSIDPSQSSRSASTPLIMILPLLLAVPRRPIIFYCGADVRNRLVVCDH